MINKTVKCFYAMLAIGLIVIAWGFCTSSAEMILISNEKVENFDRGWSCTVNGEPAGQGLSLPGRVEAKKYDVVLIENELPDVYPEGMTVCIRSTQQFVRVFLGGEEVYTFGYDSERTMGKSPGSIWNFVRIPKGTEGQKISIELISPYSSFTGCLSQITYGSKNANVFNIIGENLPGLFISVIILIIGLLLLVAAYYLRRMAKSEGLLFLGLFAILSGLWSAMESRMLQFVFSNHTMLLNSAFVLLMLIAVPLLLFIAKTHSIKNKLPLYVMAYVLMGDFLLCTLLQVFNIADYMEIILLVHAPLVVTIALMVYTMLLEIIKYKNKSLYLLALGSFLLMGFSMVDLVKYYRLASTDNAFFFRIGVLLYIIVLSYHTAKQMVLMVGENLQASMLAKLAFLDLLTNLQNRTAFETHMDFYRKGELACKGLTIGIFDINNLKLANDTFGHKQGDLLIITTANCLRNALGEWGEIFRIGGDEFAVFLVGADDASIASRSKVFDEEVASANAKAQVKLSVAYGFMRFDPLLDDTVDNLYVRADALMYEQKMRIKGAGRRRTDIVF